MADYNTIREKEKKFADMLALLADSAKKEFMTEFAVNFDSLAEARAELYCPKCGSTDKTVTFTAKKVLKKKHNNDDTNADPIDIEYDMRCQKCGKRWQGVEHTSTFTSQYDIVEFNKRTSVDWDMANINSIDYDLDFLCDQLLREKWFTKRL